MKQVTSTEPRSQPSCLQTSSSRDSIIAFNSLLILSASEWYDIIFTYLSKKLCVAEADLLRAATKNSASFF